ncbi:MAG TPA: hypothetical protein PK079_16860 [Leptospiraceae bacterium]|nr:hypothetical protein [Leptospiraceae bacterium]HMW06109.1 hypothetical protein [Leptospiraceae bacterium]HMX30763.1 hypothetical protein [Leptospiraceae bacterium]HMY31770.1 hypothetical protein [Leptospiraceae bacterium]HMZ63101.1 hypothetical protein [Leptospiraceae bacterium]
MIIQNKNKGNLIYLLSFLIFLSLFCNTEDRKPKEAIVYLKDNTDGTIEDTRYNYTWQKCSMGQTQNEICAGSAVLTNWLSAMQYCKHLKLANKK